MLTELQLLYAAVLTSTLVWFLKLYSKTNKKWNPKAGQLSVLVFVASYVVALFFGGYQFAPFPAYVDVLTFVPLLLTWGGSIIAVLSVISGVAMLIYSVVWKKVLEWMAGRPSAISAYLAKRK